MTAESTADAGTESPTDPIHVDGPAALEEVVESNDVVLADFYADWCGPCQMIEPIVASIAEETPAAVAKVDVDANQQLASSYGVRGVPTLVLFADGEQAEQIVGLQGEDHLRSLIDSYTA